MTSQPSPSALPGSETSLKFASSYIRSEILRRLLTNLLEYVSTQQHVDSLRVTIGYGITAHTINVFAVSPKKPTVTIDSLVLQLQLSQEGTGVHIPFHAETGTNRGHTFQSLFDCVSFLSSLVRSGRPIPFRLTEDLAHHHVWSLDHETDVFILFED